MLNIFVNSQSHALPKGSSLFNALEQNEIQSQRGIAVAVNNAVIPKAEWPSKILNENDKITIIKATQGG